MPGNPWLRKHYNQPNQEENNPPSKSALITKNQSKKFNWKARRKNPKANLFLAKPTYFLIFSFNVFLNLSHKLQFSMCCFFFLIFVFFFIVQVIFRSCDDWTIFLFNFIEIDDIVFGKRGGFGGVFWGTFEGFSGPVVGAFFSSFFGLFLEACSWNLRGFSLSWNLLSKLEL